MCYNKRNIKIIILRKENLSQFLTFNDNVCLFSFISVVILEFLNHFRLQ